MLTSLTVCSLSFTSKGTFILLFHHATFLQSTACLTFLRDNFLPSHPSSNPKPFPDPFPSLLSVDGLVSSYFTEKLKTIRRELTQAPTNTCTYLSASVCNYSGFSTNLDELFLFVEKTNSATYALDPSPPSHSRTSLWPCLFSPPF